ncbi:MAG TPA: CopD family protein [Candidatus Binataceae bacterium]|nr:CopD family protein [Candidatus Binataceae bacterium]
MIAGPAIFAWPLLAAQLLIFGTAAFALMTAGLAPGDRIVLHRRLAIVWRALGLAILGFSPLAFVEMAAGMAQMSWWRVLPLLGEILGQTEAGRAWRWRFAVTALLAAAAWVPMRIRAAALAMLPLAGALLLFGSITSHAIDFGSFSIAVDFIHQAGAALWIGALASMLLGCAEEPGRTRWIRAAAPRVSAIAASAVGILTVTGLYMAHERIGWKPHLMIDAMYGRTLLWKLVTFGLVLTAAAQIRLRIIMRLEDSSAREILIRNVAAECVLLAAVLGWSAILANTPPPH